MLKSIIRSSAFFSILEMQLSPFLLCNFLHFYFATNTLYDAIYQCDIIGSSDASIQNVIPSDLSPVFKEADIEQVFCNGGTAYRYYQKYQERKTGYRAIQLPSTSPANARFSMDDLYERWKIIRESVGVVKTLQNEQCKRK